MNAKYLLVLLVVLLTMVAAACIPAITDEPGSSFSEVQSVTDDPAIQVPVTGKAESNVESEIQTHPDFKLHSSCISTNSLRQDACVEQEPAGTSLSSASRISDGQNEQNAHSYPRQKTHSACSSEDNNRQASCVE